MQTAASLSKNSKAQHSRQHIFPAAGGARPHGSAKAGTHAAAAGRIGFHLLAKTLRSYPVFELEINKSDSRWKELLAIINTEAKQLQAIADLHAIYIAQPKYKSAKPANWKGDEEPVELIAWYLRRLSVLAEGNNWQVDTWKDGRKTRYRFVVSKDYSGYDIKYEEAYLPLDFLPGLKERDLPLHDLIIDVVALVSKCNAIPLWDEDCDFSASLKKLLDAPERGYSSEKILRQRFDYTEGYAAEYLTIIKDRRQNADIELVARCLRCYKSASNRKEQMAWWLMLGLEMASTGKNLTPFSYKPPYADKGLSTERLYKFVWSLHRNDIVNTIALQKLKQDMGPDDTKYLPVQLSITKPGEVITKPEFDRFPVRLYYFMSEGATLVGTRFKDYFYKNKLGATLTPSETLIDIFETQEFTAEAKI